MNNGKDEDRDRDRDKERDALYSSSILVPVPKNPAANSLKRNSHARRSGREDPAPLANFHLCTRLCLLRLPEDAASCRAARSILFFADRVRTILGSFSFSFSFCVYVYCPASFSVSFPFSVFFSFSFCVSFFVPSA